MSRSHTKKGSLKTTASRAELHDIFRSWIKKNPVKMTKISETSPARVLLAKEPSSEANFTPHKNAITKDAKLVRYQQNPLPNWGPGSRAVAGSGTKRKRQQGDE